MNSKIEQLLPHRPPMIMIDSIVQFDEDSATATKTFTSGEYGVIKGDILESLLIESLAQTVAALHGHHARQFGGQTPQGMLVGVNNFEFYNKVKLDEKIELTVKITKCLGPFRLASGQIKQGSTLIAQGGVKFYIEENSDETKAAP